MEHGNFDGSYRISIVQDAIDQSRQVVYLEWIDSLHERARSYREYGVRIREINGKLWRLERPKFYQVGKDFVITIPATHRYLDQAAEFQIWPWVNHQYLFRQEPLPPEAARQIRASHAERAVGGADPRAGGAEPLSFPPPRSPGGYPPGRGLWPRRQGSAWRRPGSIRRGRRSERSAAIHDSRPRRGSGWET